MPVILYRNKKKGIVLSFDYEKETVIFKNFISKSFKEIPIEDLIKQIEGLNSEPEKDYEIAIYSDEEIERAKKRVTKRCLSFSPVIVKEPGNIVFPFNPKGIFSLISKWGNSTLNESEKKILYINIISYLIEKYFINRDAPSLLTIEKVVKRFVEDYMKTKKIDSY